MDKLNDFITLNGLVKVNSLDEILSQNFLFEISLKDQNFNVHPVTKKAHLVHNLLNLYGNHWHYHINLDTDTIQKVEGDEETYFSYLTKGIPFKSKCLYAFTKKDLLRYQNLFLFNNQNFNQTLNEKLVNLYDSDMNTYLSRKSELKK